MALIVVFLFYSLRNPIRFDFVDVLTFLDVLWTGLLRTFVHTWVCSVLSLSPRTGSSSSPTSSAASSTTPATPASSSTAIPVVTSLSPLSLTSSSVVQVLAFFVTLAVMWAYENAHVAVRVATYA